MPALGIVIDAERTGFRAMASLVGADGQPMSGEQAIADGKLIHLSNDAEIEVGALHAGMRSGAPSAAFCFKLPDGRVVFAETSLALLLTAADTLKAVYGDPRSSDGNQPLGGGKRGA